MAHWLMKTEPDVFGIDDLARVRVEPWTGVRNSWAKKYMRDDMQVGDSVLFYHSSCQPPGVAGIARVSRTKVVDETQFEVGGKYHDEAATRDAPVWWCVEVEFVEKLPRLVALDELRRADGLAEMMVLRVPRLSVQPVTPAEYDVVMRLAREPASVDPAAGKPKPRPKPKRKQKPKPKPKKKLNKPKKKRKPKRR